MSQTQEKPVILISGPSGVGKNTLIDEILKQIPRLKMTISATTRAKRAHEIDGQHYYFYTHDTFDEKINNQEFVEWCNVHHNKYGTLKSEIDRIQDEGNQVLLEIDTQGAKKIFETNLNICSIFIRPPSLEILEKRLKHRKTETEDEIRNRLNQAKVELNDQHLYDHIVINNKKECAIQEILDIIQGLN